MAKITRKVIEKELKDSIESFMFRLNDYEEKGLVTNEFIRNRADFELRTLMARIGSYLANQIDTNHAESAASRFRLIANSIIERMDQVSETLRKTCEENHA